MKFKLPLNQNQEEEDLFDETDFDPSEIMEAMTGIVKIQQQSALDLTKLIIENCKEHPITKEYVFQVFGEAVSFLKLQLKQDAEEKTDF